MKIFSFFLLAAGMSMLFIGCGKNNETTVAAIGTLSNAGNCLPSTVHGLYHENTSLVTGNYIDVEADIQAAGLFAVATDTVNGYSFKGSGRIGRTGLNTIRLYGSGKPLLSGDDTFLVKFDNTGASSCTVDVSVE